MHAAEGIDLDKDWPVSGQGEVSTLDELREPLPNYCIIFLGQTYVSITPHTRISSDAALLSAAGAARALRSTKSSN